MLPERVVTSSNPQDYDGASGKTKKWKSKEAKWGCGEEEMQGENGTKEREGKEQRTRRRKKKKGGINFPEGEETDWIERGEREGKEREKRGSLRTEHRSWW
jgi:hypothetical protein